MALSERDKPWRPAAMRQPAAGAHGRRQTQRPDHDPQRERNRHPGAAWYLALLQQELCAYCGNWTSPVERTREHVVALCLGGRTAPDNMVMACRGCNACKNARGVLGLLTIRVRKSRRAEVVAAICELTGLTEEQLCLLRH